MEVELIQAFGFTENREGEERWDPGVFLLPYRDVACLARRVPEAEFGEGILSERLKDLEWMNTQVLTHERILEEAMKTRTVIPLKWGALFRNPEAVQEVMASRYPTIQAQLGKLKGRTEWTVKVLVDSKQLNACMSATHPAIQRLKSEMEQQPSGTAYLLKERLKLLTKEVGQERIQEVIQVLYGELMRHAEASASADPVGEPTPPNGLELAFQMVFLVRRENQPSFSEAILQAARRWKAQGFELYQVGPFPAYYFSQLAEGENLHG